MFGCEMRIVDDEGRELPWDGEAYGALQVRGPWICSDYFKLEGSAGIAHRRRLVRHRRRRDDRSATATWRSPTAPRTSSSPAVSGSARSNSRTRRWAIPPWPRRP